MTRDLTTTPDPVLSMTAAAILRRAGWTPAAILAYLKGAK